MRKTVVTVLAAGLLVGSLGATANAGKKTVTKNFTLLAPVAAPILTDVDPNGCLNTEEDVSKDTYAFKAPKHKKSGTLSVRIDGFEGDWDLFVLKGDTVLAESTSDNLSQDFEAVTVGRIKGGTKLNIVGCNWSGSPQAEGSLAYKYKK